MQGKFVIAVAAGILIFAGCAPRMQKPMRVCPGAESVAESLSLLRPQLQQSVSFKANGQCLLLYYDGDKKPKKENFQVKLWLNPPAQIRLQGDVAFNPKGIVLGSNENEFWLSMKPKEIGNSYFWGSWAGRSCFEQLLISPELLLEAFGIVKINDEKNWSLSNEGAFDILTKRDERNKIIKKIYVYSCDYTVVKIEYFDKNAEIIAVTELDKYREMSRDFLVPSVIKITTRVNDDSEESFRISLKSIKPTSFTEKKRNIFFARPEPKGFEHIYKISENCDVIEQP